MPEVHEATADLGLQRGMLEFVLAPGADDAWPSIGLEPPSRHDAAVQRSRPRLLTYRELVRASLWDPVEAAFPISRALVGDAAWEACRGAFLAAGCVRSRHYRDIPAAFVGWLAENGWGSENWPALLPLAHYELVEVLVSLAPDPPPGGALRTEPSLERRVRLHPSARVLSYPFAVHRATPDHPHPEALPTDLLAYRDGEDAYRLLEITPATSALLMRAQDAPLLSAMEELGLRDTASAFQILSELRRQGAILGFLP